MFSRFIDSLETAPMTIAGWLAGFAGVLWIRYLIENFSSPNVSDYLTSDLPTLLHYTLFYLFAVIALVVVASAVLRTSPRTMARASLFFLPLIWLGPLIDLLHGGAQIGYLFALTPGAFVYDFLSYFGPLSGSGVTVGLRIEIGLIILAVGAYGYTHTRNWLRVILSMIATYAVLFLAFCSPSLLGFMLSGGVSGSSSVLVDAMQSALISHNFLHPSDLYSAYRTLELLFDAVMAQFGYLILCIVGFIWFYRVKKNAVLAVIRNIRPERLLHFLLAAAIGGLIALAENSHVAWNALDVITMLVTACTIAFAWIFAVTINDLVDEPIDAISNTDRPLVTGSLTSADMRDIAFVSGMMTLFGGLALGSYALFWILLFSAAYYIYSAPPLRLKRIPLLASALIGVATLSITLLGFFLISVDAQLSAFPAPIALLIFFFITLVANARDLKDIEGDSAAGIWTIPTLLGERGARMTIGAMCCVAALLVPLFIPLSILWIPAVVAGVLIWGGLLWGQGERFIFTLYFLYIFSIIILVHFT